MRKQSRGVFLMEKNACGRLVDNEVLGGTLKSMSIDNNCKMHVQKPRDVFFEEQKSVCGKHIDNRVVVGRMHLAIYSHV